jgi:hypothetical protein
MTQANKHLWPVAIWGFLQLGLLGIGASGFPLWAHHPFPRESLALPILLCGQVVLINLQLPKLSGQASTLGIVLMLPIDELAGLLSNSSQTEILTGFACVGLWFLGLAIWLGILRNPKLELTLGMLAMLWTVGGAILDYLRWEFNASTGTIFTPVSLLPGLCRTIQAAAPAPWLQVSTPMLAGLIVMAVLSLLRRGPTPPSTSLHSAS